MLMPSIGFPKYYQFLSSFFFWRQDLLLAFLFLLVPILPLQLDKTPLSGRFMAFFATPYGLCTVVAFLIVLCWAGSHFVMLGYNLSRDEQMADFDAYIYAHGRLFWPLPQFWQTHAQALNQTFILAIADHSAWVSAYLPVNAALRAITGFLVPASLTSPLLVALGAVSLWRIARRLWPHSSSTAGVAVLLYAGSSQVLLNGMTGYAMSGHLALNLVWLDLFLLNKKWSHLGALGVGFLATGLHQPLFHPLFVLWFLVLLCIDRRWRTLGFYLTGYAIVAAFWLVWPGWIGTLAGGHVVTADPATPNYFARFIMAVRPMSLEAIWLTAMNLIRFITWQHLLLLPLMAVGIHATWNHDALGRAIAISFLLPIVVMLVLLPYQGHGWGYRYLHGVIGNACLLACYGWAKLNSQGLAPRRLLAWTTAASLLIVFPIRCVMVHQMVGAFAGVSRAIDGSPAHFAIVDDGSVSFGMDVVFNQPNLSNRPIRLLASQLRPADMPEVCARGSVEFVGGETLKPIAEYFGAKHETEARRLSGLNQAAKNAGCVLATRE